MSIKSVRFQSAACFLFAFSLLIVSSVVSSSRSSQSSSLAEEAVVAVATASEERRVSFNRDVRPILSDNCFACHGPDANKREADLRLDIELGAFKKLDDGPVIVAGHPEKSRLLERMQTHDEDLRMPPAESNKELTPKQIDLIKRWIAQGAKWEEHWSLEAPVKRDLPAVSQKWGNGAIDQFILAKLEEKGLTPSQEANKTTLVRRVTFDLTGLPATPSEVKRFLNDASPDAYEKLVDRLLASSAYGEHMSRFWLDAVRYGDTHGMHLDNYREMWPYRDWVIRAFNKNMSYDQFTTKQLAGDLLPNPTDDDLIATGYNRCHVTTNEGGTIAEEVHVRNVIDRVENMGTVFLGLTVQCSVCHTHKFDPISQKEFYQMYAFFNSIDGPPMDGNVKNHNPFLYVPSKKQKQEHTQIKSKRKVTHSGQSKRQTISKPAYKAWLAWQQQLIDSGATASAIAIPPKGLIAHFPLDKTEGILTANLVNRKQKIQLVGGESWTKGRLGNGFHVKKDSYAKVLDANIGKYRLKEPFTVATWIKTPGDIDGSIFSRMDVSSRVAGYELRAKKRKLIAVFSRSILDIRMEIETENDVLQSNQWHHVAMTYDGSGRAMGVSLYVDGKLQPAKILSDMLGTYSFHTGSPMMLGCRGVQKEKPVFPLTGATIDDFRVYDRLLEGSEIASIAFSELIHPTLLTAADDRTAAENALLKTFYFAQYDSPSYMLEKELITLRTRELALLKAMPTTLIYRERKTPKPAHLLNRGAYDDKGDQVQRDTPKLLPAFPEKMKKDRLGLAKWLLAPNHPLTSRVTVNRFWQQVFGTGIVKTSEDFGSQGESPSHPELLDWLAIDFRESGWDVKRFMKKLVMSKTYRQESSLTPALIKADPENRLYARGPRYRLDAEMIRDQALSLSGLLVNKMGGPSVKPPQPDGLWYAVAFTTSNTSKFVKDKGADKLYRRSLYTFLKRTSPSPQMTTFDAPNREACVVRRERTNTPLQALLLLNDPQYVEAAKFLAQRLIKEGGQTTDTRIKWGYNLATARNISDTNLAVLTKAYDGFHKHYKAHPEEAKKLIEIGETAADAKLDSVELASWIMVTNILLNLDEVVTKE